jgi:hypothetical protein
VQGFSGAAPQQRDPQHGGRGEAARARPAARGARGGGAGRPRLLHLLHHPQPDLPPPHGGRAVQGERGREVR